MIHSIRTSFNKHFSTDAYTAMVQKIHSAFPHALDFRNAETPIFIPKEFTNKMMAACDEIIHFIKDKDFKLLTEKSIPKKYYFPDEEAQPSMMVFDFGICENERGEIVPQLVEMQGFPSLFAFQIMLDELTRATTNIPDHYNTYLNGYNKERYVHLLQEIILEGHAAENVILLEVYPEKQQTRIDFECTENLLGIKTVCITKLIAENNKLYYLNNGNKTQIKRIYNRIIFEDLEKHSFTEPLIDFSKHYDIEWVCHPNWFYRISKFTLPFIQSPFIPDTYFLNEIKQALPLNEYVLKPLFSYAGMGVNMNVLQSDIDQIKDPENWILQKKVQYASVIETLDQPAKAEIRLFYFWKKNWQKPIAVHNLARLSKGDMIGTRYNQDKTWVGGTIAYFET